MYVLRIEQIGDNWRYLARAIEAGQVRYPSWRDELSAIRYGQKRHCGWVARLCCHSGQIQREFVSGVRDYERADRLGERGIFQYFYLDDGLYEVNEPIGLGKARRYYARISGVSLCEISEQEVKQCPTSTI